jgi:hypothetical protein
MGLCVAEGCTVANESESELNGVMVMLDISGHSECGKLIRLRLRIENSAPRLMLIRL